MGDRIPILRRPVRTAAIAAGVVAPVCAGAAFAFSPDAPIMVAFAVGYGVLLGWYVVGLLLASSYRVTRWWFFGLALPLMCMGIVSVILAYGPESIWRPAIGLLIGVSQFILIAWLTLGFILAFCGWWSYALHRRGCPNARIDRG